MTARFTLCADEIEFIAIEHRGSDLHIGKKAR